MNNILIYLLKSTLCISLLYLVFRVVMRKESFFALNRILLLSIVFTSVLIPLFHLPQAIQSPVQMELLPFLTSDETQTVAGSNISIVQPIEQSLSVESVPVMETNNTVFCWHQLLQYLYLAGLLITLLMLAHGLFSILMLFRKAKSIKTGGYRLLVIEKEIAAFSFGRTVIISQKDYSEHRQPILTHEQAHIQLNHFFDLLLLEIVRIFHWFNPFVYWLIRDMKEIHEFQADDFTLNKGIDATQYQLLIIQKGVGPQRFALANSFNYCQIKKRIAMMNKQKTRKAWNWKVVTFLPLLALLLMAFGKEAKNAPLKGSVSVENFSPSEIVQINKKYPYSMLIEIRKDGNYMDNKLCPIEEIIKQAQEWEKTPKRDILLLLDDQIPYNRIDEVREALLFKDIHNVNQKYHNSDELIFPEGDVTERATFSNGKWADWLIDKLTHYSKNLKYTITFSFVIDKHGKVSDGHVIKGCDSPEKIVEFEQILSQIPDWIPAKKGNDVVSVICRRSVSWNPNTEKFIKGKVLH